MNNNNNNNFDSQSQQQQQQLQQQQLQQQQLQQQQLQQQGQTTTMFRSFSGTRLCEKSMSDSILLSYQRSRSDERLNQNAQFPTRSVSLSSDMATSSSSTSQRRHTTCPTLSNSGWGAEASFGILQRSAEMKEDILASLSKIQESIKMVLDLQPQSHQNDFHNLQSLPSPQLSLSKNPQLTQFCENQIMQNLSKIVLFVQDQYYRVVVVNNQGIETILTVMNLFTHVENLLATCNLALGILCTNSPQCRIKVVELNGIPSIVASVRNISRSHNVCSSAVDALSILSYSEFSIPHLCQIEDLIDLLSCVDEYLYPLSKQNRDILISHLKGVCPDCNNGTDLREIDMEE